MRTLGLIGLLAALVGCGSPEGSEGKTVDVQTLNKAQAAQTPDDGVKPPTAPSDGPGGGR